MTPRRPLLASAVLPLAIALAGAAAPSVATVHGTLGGEPVSGTIPAP